MINLLLTPYGRISRAAFWMVNCLLLVIGLSLVWLLFHQGGAMEAVSGGIPDGPFVPPPIASDPWAVVLLLALPVSWIQFCLIAKRWHDRGKSAWWSLIVLVPILGLAWMLIEIGLLPGTPSGNRYGGATSRYRDGTWSTDELYGDAPDDMP